jgi:hypothetical protein
MFLAKDVEKNQTTRHIQELFSSGNRAVYEIMWKNMVESGRPQMTIWRMRIAYWIHKSTSTHSEYVILLLHNKND